MSARRSTAPLAALLALAVGLWASVVEPRRLVVRRARLEPPGWPEALDGLVVACVSDLHAGAPHVKRRRVERVVRRVQSLAPDLVALLGDYVDPSVRGGRRIAPAAVAEALGRLRAPLGVVAVLGNHDWLHEGRRVPAALRAAGIRVLEDEAVPLGEGLWVAGMADLRTRDPDPEWALDRVPPGDAVIALSHDPDLFPRIPRRVALTLSGHTHGGQVDVPGLRALAIPSRHGARYAHGPVREDGRLLYVTSGIGTSGWPVRLRRPPEIALLTLRAPGRTGSP